jgi:pimeloyl-ACP methyl ester carboxylesterase
MKTIILPGYSPKNKEWAENIKKEISFSDVLVHEWRHWEMGSFNINYEIGQIMEKIGDGKANIIAKSVGTRVAIHLLERSPDIINKLVLCGIPTKGENEKTFELYKNGLGNISPERVEVFQNVKDYFASYENIVTFIGKINKKIKITKMPRSDHHYPYPIEFEKFLTEE